MPSGKTHDRITLWCLPWIILLTQLITENWRYTALVSGGFLFGGLMFGPDLDIHSIQLKRWGWLRWIWYPYQWKIPHRSWLSHGFLAGTLVRLMYLLVWAALGTLLVLEFSQKTGQTSLTWQDLRQAVRTLFLSYWRIWLPAIIGIEIGAMSHAASDWLSSSRKRARRRKSASRRVRR